MITFEATVEAILTATDPSTFVTRRLQEVQLEFGGIPGDRHFGVTFPADIRQPMYPRGTLILNRRQLSLLSAEECAMIAEQLQIEQVLPEWLGANLLLRGVPDLTQLKVGSRLLFPSGAGLVCEGENLPCVYSGDEVRERSDRERKKLPAEFVQAATKRRGLVASVECPGWIRVGDTVRILVNDLENPMQ